MNTLVPIQYYALVYFNTVLLLSLIIFFQSFQSKIESKDNLNTKKVLGFLFLLFVVLHLGLRPINFRFGDMVIYNIEFQRYVYGAKFDSTKDVLFESFKYFCATFLNAPIFFFLCATLYVLPLYSVSKKLFKAYWFYAFFLLIASFSFWAYGTNGIRNGIVTSLFLYAITRNSTVLKWSILIACIFIHKSIIIPIVIYLFVKRFNYTKMYFYFWLDRKSTRLNSSHRNTSRMPSSA